MTTTQSIYDQFSSMLDTYYKDANLMMAKAMSAIETMLTDHKSYEDPESIKSINKDHRLLIWNAIKIIIKHPERQQFQIADIYWLDQLLKQFYRFRTANDPMNDFESSVIALSNNTKKEMRSIVDTLLAIYDGVDGVRSPLEDLNYKLDVPRLISTYDTSYARNGGQGITKGMWSSHLGNS